MWRLAKPWERPRASHLRPTSRGGGVSRANACTRLVREPLFPEPVATISGQAVWLVAEATLWRSYRDLFIAQARCEWAGEGVDGEQPPPTS